MGDILAGIGLLVTGVVLGALVTLMGVMPELDGNAVHTKMIKECQAELPRNQFCELVAVKVEGE